MNIDPAVPPESVAPAPGTFPTKVQSRARKWLVRAVALFASFAFAFLLLEILVRVAGLDVPRVWVPDRVIGWHHLPGSKTQWTEEGNGQVAINSLGYRDRLDRAESKRPGTFRIAMIGDSMTEGVQVNLDQTFCSLLEGQLSTSSRPVEVLNLGVNGYGPVQELLLLRREFPRFKPDLVVLGVFLDNDIADCDVRLRYTDVGVPFGTVVDGKLQIDHSRAERSYDDYQREPVRTIRAASAAYRMFRDRLGKLPVARSSPAVNDQSGSVIRRYQLYQKNPPPQWEDAWATFEQVLVEFADEARRQQTRFLILSLPAGQVVSPSGWQSVLDKHPGMAGVSFDLDGPERRLAEMARKRGFKLAQPYTDYRQASHDPALFFGNVGHFTPAGHEVMTRYLRWYLARHFSEFEPLANP